MLEKIFWEVAIKFMSKGGRLMMAMFFAQRVILGKATYDPSAPANQQIPATLKQPVADILLESGLEFLVPVEYGGTAQFDA